MSYQLTADADTVIRLDDGATVPRGHRFWAEYEDWIAAGGSPEPALVLEPGASERTWRDTEIERVKWLRERHRDEVDSARPTTMTVKQSGELLDYVQALRDWPASKHFPAKKYRPTTPDWVTEHAR